MNERLQARVDKIEAEIARREAKALSTSERQALYILRANKLLEAAIADDEDRDEEDRDDTRDRGVWGDDDHERPELDGDATSRRQAARITRGRSS